MSIFGQVVTGREVSQAVVTTVETWIEVYLREIERQHTLSYELPVFASYNTRPEQERWVEEQLPALIVVVPGLADAPRKDGDGVINAPWRVHPVVFSLGPDKATTDTNSKLYAAAVRAILLQHASLGGFSDGLVWEGEDYDIGPPQGGRTIGSAVLNFVVHVPEATVKGVGPHAPPNLNQVGSEWPIAETTGLRVEKKED
jgi:hypothetical protein